MTKILLVEDDETIISNLTEFLKTEGFYVKAASDQESALKLVGDESFDLVLLDVSLSRGNGFAVCSAIKKSGRPIPIIFLTASDDESSVLTGFELGADDYVPKPFRPRELVMRIKNILRLTSGGESAVSLGNARVDLVKGSATKNGADLYLSALEYKLLLVFINNRGATLTRTALLEAVWDSAGEFVSDNALTVYIKRLREKIEDDPQNPKIIKTVRGIGYRADV